MDFISGLPEGRVIEVTYYSQNAPVTDTVSKHSDMVTDTRDKVHLSYTEIRNFELRLQEDIKFEYAEDTNKSELSGSALVLPGFVPRINDIFLYMVRNSKIAVFIISGIQRLAIGQETYHQVNFTMQEYLSEKKRNILKSQSTVWYFDKRKYMVGNQAMLTTDGYIQQKELTHIRKEIIRNYIDRFYDRSFSSFMRPDGIYDPYIVEYWNRKISVLDTNLRPLQLLISMQNFNKTIWAALTNNPIKDLRNIETNYSTMTYTNTFWGSNITSLLGHKFLAVGNESGAKQNPSIDKDGNPSKLVTQTPFFHTTMWDDAVRRQSLESFNDMREAFYDDFLPYRTCAPHQHPIDIPNMCDPNTCKEFCNENGKPEEVIKLKPPYPVVSDSYLFKIWGKLNNISFDQPLTESQIAEARGYVVWYRETYPGTLSRVELEAEWRKKAGISSDKVLSDIEEAALIEYIKSYRSQYPQILSNRELEVIWRIEKRIDLNIVLTDDQLVELAIHIKAYRDIHGYPPEDGYEIEFPILGSPISTEEVQKAQGLTYNDIFIMDITLEELSKAIDEAELPSIEEPEIPENIPTVFIKQHPKHNHSLHCHSICHAQCGLHARPSVDDFLNKSNMDTAYGLSPAFYLGSMAMDPFERVVYDTLTNKEIRPDLILDAVCRYIEWDNEEAFYRHLFAIYLIDKALYWLRYRS